MATLVHDTLCATLSGLSKVYRACGYRVGWAAFSGRTQMAHLQPMLNDAAERMTGTVAVLRSNRASERCRDDDESLEPHSDVDQHREHEDRAVGSAVRMIEVAQLDHHFGRFRRRVLVLAEFGFECTSDVVRPPLRA